MNDPGSTCGEEILPGTLYVVSTPIGNLADITYRAVHILENVDIVAAEDTRRTRTLMEHYNIPTPMVSYHEHNARKVLPELVSRLTAGLSLALVSDAGTPTLSDPGYRLVRAAHESGRRVVPIPGASAALAALVAAGLPTDRFTFEGFLPRKKGRQTCINELADETRTIILFESPLRTPRTLRDLAECLGPERKAVVCRELTKRFEEFIHGSLGELSARYENKPPRGEVTILVEGKGKKRVGKQQRECDER